MNIVSGQRKIAKPKQNIAIKGNSPQENNSIALC